ncbi:MAG: helix-turn-helix domain-containing protein [Spirochaetia bacterium]|nr:helix-turn-helix domain-containing protein [Spirochaetia bacterium]
MTKAKHIEDLIRDSPERLSDYRIFPVFLKEKDIPERIEPHFHDFFEIDLIVQGEGTNISAGKKYAFRPGDLLLGNPFDSHEIVCKSPTRVLGIKFNPLALRSGEEKSTWLLDPFLRRGSGFRNLVRLENAEVREKIGSLAKLFQEEFQEKKPGRETALLSILELLLVTLRREFLSREKTTPSTTGKSDGPLLYMILEHVNKNFLEALDLESLASEWSISPKYLSRFFKEKAGIPFKQFLIQKRIQKARELLETSDHPILNISMESGFNDVSVFNRAFKKIHRMSPRDYKKSLKPSSNA